MAIIGSFPSFQISPSFKTPQHEQSSQMAAASLLGLPQEVVDLVVSELDTSSTAHLVLTCKGMYAKGQSTLESSIKWTLRFVSRRPDFESFPAIEDLYFGAPWYHTSLPYIRKLVHRILYQPEQARKIISFSLINSRQENYQYREEDHDEYLSRCQAESLLPFMRPNETIPPGFGLPADPLALAVILIARLSSLRRFRFDLSLLIDESLFGSSLGTKLFSYLLCQIAEGNAAQEGLSTFQQLEQLYMGELLRDRSLETSVQRFMSMPHLHVLLDLPKLRQASVRLDMQASRAFWRRQRLDQNRLGRPQYPALTKLTLNQTTYIGGVLVVLPKLRQLKVFHITYLHPFWKGERGRHRSTLSIGGQLASSLAENCTQLEDLRLLCWNCTNGYCTATEAVGYDFHYGLTPLKGLHQLRWLETGIMSVLGLVDDNGESKWSLNDVLPGSLEELTLWDRPPRALDYAKPDYPYGWPSPLEREIKSFLPQWRSTCPRLRRVQWHKSQPRNIKRSNDGLRKAIQAAGLDCAIIDRKESPASNAEDLSLCIGNCWK